MLNVAHLTSAHPRYDTRIFVKQCRSMEAWGYKVTLIVADGLGESTHDRIQIHDVGKLTDRVQRIFRSATRVHKLAESINADIYVLHDPELIPFGLRLKRLGKKVVFDSHEDVPTQLLGKPYLGRISASILATSYQAYERYACRRFDGIVGATPYIHKKLAEINSTSVAINNYPILDEFQESSKWSEKAIQVCYVGNISEMRGVRELVRASALLRSPASIALAGMFENPMLESELSMHKGWHRVRALGQIDRIGVRKVMAQSMAGLVTLHPQANYLQALPVKMFEYMAAGIPVIASDFPLWRDIIESNSCGICVDPLSPTAIAEAIDHLIAHPDLAQKMGTNGQSAIRRKYNWHTEAEKLCKFYDAL